MVYFRSAQRSSLGPQLVTRTPQPLYIGGRTGTVTVTVENFSIAFHLWR